MNPSVEILVHISGPGRVPDDARYRKEARELLEFEPVIKHQIFPFPDDENGKEEDEQQRGRDWKRGLISHGGEDTTMDELASEDVEDAVPDTAKAPSVDLLPITVASPSKQIIGQKDTLVLRSVQRSGSKILIERTPALLHRHTTAVPSTPAMIKPPHRRAASDSWKTPPSVIPDSQPTPSALGKHRATHSPCPQVPAPTSSSPSPTRAEEPRPYKRQRGQDGTITGPAKADEINTKRCLVNSSARELVEIAGHEPLQAVETLEIHPRRPSSSRDQYETHLTPSLQILSEKLPMHRYFKPLLQARTVEKLERGHWYVPIDLWDATLKIKFWLFLTQYIEEGRAGWGVWCYRQHRKDSAHSEHGKENADTPVHEDFLRVYCWGEIVGEIWVLLFVASEKKVRGSGARWIDAMNETVIQMD